MLLHRQWNVLAWNHESSGPGVAGRTVLGLLRGRARRDDARDGAGAIVQRFGMAVNLHYLHTVVLDRALVLDVDSVRFHPARRLTREELACVVPLLVRRLGLPERPGPRCRRREPAPLVEGSTCPPGWSGAASVEGRVARGPGRGRACSEAAT